MLIFKLAFVLLTLLYQVFGLDKQCPNDIFGTGCRCIFIEGFNEVSCREVQNTKTIKEKFNDTAIYDLRISINTTKLPKDFFKGLTIINLFLRGGNTLKNFEDGSFNGLEETLEYLELTGSNLTKLPNLRNIKNLRKVRARLIENDGTFSQGDADRLPLNIRKFYLDRSYFKNITANFSSLLHLERLSMMHGSIESIDKLIVGPNLKVLDLRFNKIKSFSVKFLNGAPNGVVIVLGNNGIETFTKEEVDVAIRRNIKISPIDMFYSCPCEMSWIVKMKDAAVRQLGNFECRGKSIRTFKNLLQLTDLSFEYC